MLDHLNSLQDRYWSGHSRLFEDSTHVIGGIGIGLLAGSESRASNRRIGLILLGISLALHLFAMATAQEKSAGS